MPRAWLRLACLLLLTACTSAGGMKVADNDDLAGAWRARVRFRDGAFAAIADLEFMLVFNAGGTLTESSNYDGAPPVPPAYGAWRRTGPQAYEAVYEYYATKPPARLDELATGGWMPAGRGRFVERIVLAADGQSYTSTLTYTPFDAAGRPLAGGGTARADGTRIGF
jgi:hypothetical protein